MWDLYRNKKNEKDYQKKKFCQFKFLRGLCNNPMMRLPVVRRWYGDGSKEVRKGD